MSDGLYSTTCQTNISGPKPDNTTDNTTSLCACTHILMLTTYYFETRVPLKYYGYDVVYLVKEV